MVRERSLKGMVVLGSIVLASCNQVSADKADARICTTPQVEIAQGDWGECVHKWAYRLAGSPDPAKVMADAVVSACADAIAWQVNHYEEAGLVAAGEAGREALSRDIMDSAPKHALFRVVQARAGHCDVP